MLLEICVTTFEAALRAQDAGADRIELCEDLNSGGVTPNFELIERCQKNLNIKLHVMIRPRAGNFFYTDSEFNEMKKEIEVTKRLKADGAVCGILTRDNKVDVIRTKELVELARPMKTTFHRAFDEAAEPFEALENIIECGADILLTSGQKEKALDGATLIRELHNRAKGRIEIMAGSGVTDENISEIANKTGIKSFHGSAKKINSKGGIIYADAEMIKSMKSYLQKLA